MNRFGAITAGKRLRIEPRIIHVDFDTGNAMRREIREAAEHSGRLE